MLEEEKVSGEIEVHAGYGFNNILLELFTRVLPWLWMNGLLLLSLVLVPLSGSCGIFAVTQFFPFFWASKSKDLSIVHNPYYIYGNNRPLSSLSNLFHASVEQFIFRINIWSTLLMSFTHWPVIAIGGFAELDEGTSRGADGPTFTTGCFLHCMGLGRGLGTVIIAVVSWQMLVSWAKA